VCDLVLSQKLHQCFMGKQSKVKGWKGQTYYCSASAFKIIIFCFVTTQDKSGRSTSVPSV
jgi:hypothetical protein